VWVRLWHTEGNKNRFLLMCLTRAVQHSPKFPLPKLSLPCHLHRLPPPHSRTCKQSSSISSFTTPLCSFLFPVPPGHQANDPFARSLRWLSCPGQTLQCSPPRPGSSLCMSTIQRACLQPPLLPPVNPGPPSRPPV
jgi:hypothetical protein